MGGGRGNTTLLQQMYRASLMRCFINITTKHNNTRTAHPRGHEKLFTLNKEVL
uniref:Uncharacterized protein n=1 Tax=Anguilla anguilla TaxID=7936 RepID=A0A0E9XMP3_ANGAN